MHGLIFVTWERYLAERFPGSVLGRYRDAIGETPATAPLASRVYDDATLLTGVGAASRITGLPADRLLREYGHYFISNGLTGNLCAYLLNQVHSGRDLLLAMHDAHEQMSRLPEGLTPPLFKYAALPDTPWGLILIYEDPRQLCSVLIGAIEGAADRYEEQVYIVEQTCMKRGDRACRFELRFSAPSPERLETPEQRERRQEQQQFAQFILALLPYEGGVTLAELQTLLKMRGMNRELTRPARLLEALRHLHHAGLVATSANQPGDDLTHRRYWRAPTSD
ncbi:MAG: heme NO-binding domain-containing protein [Ktedonobacteraceae bacterium]